jgi:RNA polymerase sigma-70 factor (ECF subfamily)
VTCATISIPGSIGGAPHRWVLGELFGSMVEPKPSRASPGGQAAAGGGEDLALVERANLGDADAFEALYRRHKDWVLGVARRYTARPDDALDVLQETFAYFCGKFPGFTLTAQLRSFLFPVVKHSALTRRRKERGLDDLESVSEARLAVPPVEPSEIETLLASLPETHREVVWLRFAEDMSLKDIALALDVPLGTVKSRLHNGIQMIRKAHEELRGPRDASAARALRDAVPSGVAKSAAKEVPS